MISIIICSRQQDIPEELRKNIRETIGSEHEIIVIDNSQNQYSIFSAYNKGVSLSKHPLLLFMHDDVLHYTSGWGLKLIDHFKDSNVGSVGIGGTAYLAYTPGGWWDCGAAHLHLLQTVKKGEEPVLLDYFPKGSIKEEVVVLDGVWFCIRRELFSSIRFDEKTYSGFHYYDIDTTLQVYQAGYKVLCVKDILIIHLSPGRLDQKWVENALLFHEKWRKQLPISVHKYGLGRQCNWEYRMVTMWLNNLLRTGSKKKSQIYLDALRRLLDFKKAYLCIKTPLRVSTLLGNYLKNLLMRR